MNLISLRFVVFLAATALVYYLFPVKKYQWVVLLAASYVFYAFTGLKYAAYILFTTLTSYGATRWMAAVQSAAKAKIAENKEIWDKAQRKAYRQQQDRKAKRIAALALLLNFGVLLVLKYLPPIFSAANGSFGLSLPTLSLVLPLGISFYTFQTMGYVIDVSRGEVEAEKNPAKLALFVSFFPQLIQGPIGRWDPLAEQLFAEHRADYTRIVHGLELALWGLFKKLVIADRAAVAIQAVTAAPSSFSGSTLGFTVLLYALQLYADFSGGIDIARAAAQILGIDLAQNFRQPYFATSLTDYWNRWHITLGAWMKNYVFYPIALSKLSNRVSSAIRGSRFGQTKAGAHIAVVLPGTVASLIVFLIVGIWHGAGSRYILYGLWNGGIIMLSILLKPCFEWLNRVLQIDASSPEHRVFQIMRTFLLVCVGNITDLARGGRDCFVWLRRILTELSPAQALSEINASLGLTVADYHVLLFGTVLLYIVGVIRERHPDTPLRDLLDRRPVFVRWLLIFFCAVAVIVFGMYGPGYSATEFAYMQF